jgi:hypothetical protein
VTEDFIKKALNEIIRLSLYEPGGDPLDEQYRAAAWAYSLAKDIGVVIDGDASIRKILLDETGNNYLFESECLRLTGEKPK